MNFPHGGLSCHNTIVFEIFRQEHRSALITAFEGKDYGVYARYFINQKLTQKMIKDMKIKHPEIQEMISQLEVIVTI